jgi:uncharacterized oxidoreductase
MNLSNNKILITGGATGIGLGLTEKFLAEGNTVLICGRRVAALKAVSDKYPSVIARVCDLSKTDEREQLYNWISTEHSDLNVLINNAGIQDDVPLHDTLFFQQAEKAIAINVEAPIHLASLFSQLKSMNTILNVTSGLGFVPIARMPVYCATKAFLHSFTLSLRHLLKPNNIEVIEIIPPAVDTDLGGQGRHDYAPSVDVFVSAVFKQLQEQKAEITYGFSEGMLKAGPEEQQKAFERMNR